MNEREIIIENQRKILMEEQTRELQENEELIKNFISDCNKLKIPITISDIKFISKIGIVATYPDLLTLLNKKIKVDKEELVSFKVLDKEFTKKTWAPGYFAAKNFMAMAHPYFRRGHYKNEAFAPRFLEIFCNYISTKNDKYLGLDLDRVRINLDSRMLMEFDSWYGSKFDQDISKIEDGITKLRPPVDLEPAEIDFLFGNVYSLDIKWYTKESVENNINTKIKVFQAEEFKEPECRIIKDGNEYFPAKYIHAEFDLKNGTFRHLDGAIHFYTEKEYFQRRETDFNHNDKNPSKIKTLSQKLFKVNGEIHVNDWVELTSHYLAGNPLIFEYFEGKLPDKIIEMVEKIRSQK
ncbi:hypothetical protein [Flavobacterium sp. LC2016-01]|uniref:hypothetical protein n=1 Tax=Flavobacterium sp. LC2016-01 TaxID=2675876 RepID=UPI0012BAB33F|nr:hypothetical protein [Flavobacterium sp. LC2016-01]MTH15905.1 hypothetical protein [Flavobacterium sp. LC2016-01]